MDFTLSKKHEMARTLFKEFAEKEVKPLAQDVDENEQFPVETVAKMAKAGFLGIPVPKEYGGQGCDPLTYVMCVEELSKVCGTTGVIVSAHTSLCIDPIQTFGTEEQTHWREKGKFRCAAHDLYLFYCICRYSDRISCAGFSGQF